MADAGLGQLFVAALGGGFTVKLLDIAYQEYRRRKAQSQTAEQFVDQHLDPLLKAADELVGKLRALAEGDFKSIHRITPDEKCLSNHDFGSLIFLFSRFWAQVEIIRQEGMSVAMAKDGRGLQLQSFFDCFRVSPSADHQQNPAEGCGRSISEREGDEDLRSLRRCV
jgi:hypothetical protein